ncbi:MAG: hypothetical protein FWD71_08180 [Oscillospiraceae bacterium]|nr:hypothetical protein [Oscillospiraceae bacterium]
MKEKIKPKFEVINNNNEEQMNILINKIIEETLKKEKYNIMKFNPNISKISETSKITS